MKFHAVVPPGARKATLRVTLTVFACLAAVLGPSGAVATANENFFVKVVAGTGKVEKSNGDGLAINTHLDVKHTLFHPVTGDLYFTDTNMRSSERIRMLTVDEQGRPEVVTVAGGKDLDEGGDGPATERAIAPEQMMFHPTTGELHFIDGYHSIRRLTLDKRGRTVVKTVAGTGERGFNGDGVATEMNITLRQMAFHPVTGELYFIDDHDLLIGGERIRKLTVNDTGETVVVTVAGAGEKQFNGDGVGTETNINPMWMAFHPQTGELHFVDGASRIRKLTLDEEGQTIVQTLAGTGKTEFNGDQTPLAANIDTAWIGFHPRSGELYFNDDWKNWGHSRDNWGHSRIRKLTVDSDGQPTVQTVAGTGVTAFNGDGSALTVNVHPEWMAFHPHSGELYFSHGGDPTDSGGGDRIRRLTVDNQGSSVVQTVASEDVSPQRMVFHPHSGDLYFTDGDSAKISVVVDLSPVSQMGQIKQLKQVAAEAVYDRVEGARKRAAAPGARGPLSLAQLARLTDEQREAHRAYLELVKEFSAYSTPQINEQMSKLGGLSEWVRNVRRERLLERERVAAEQHALEEARVLSETKRPEGGTQTKRARGEGDADGPGDEALQKRPAAGQEGEEMDLDD